MRKLWITFLKDAKLSFNSLYFYIEVGMALLFIAIMLFVVPENFDSRQTLFLHVDLPEPARGALMEQMDGEDANLTLFDSLEDMKQALSKDHNAMGVDVTLRDGQLHYEVVLQGYESQTLRALFKAGIEGEMLSQLPGYEQRTTVTTLAPGAQRLSDRENVLTIYLVMNVALMGLFIIAAYVFNDKEEGTIKAFAVAPVRVWHYLASKLLIMVLTGIVTSVITALALVGTGINYLILIGLVAAFNLFGSALGLFVTSFFGTMTKAMGALYLCIMVMMAAVVAFFMPSFNPLWVRWLPTYPMLFAFREMLLPGGDTGYALAQMGIFLGLGLLIFLAANLRYKKTLTV